MRSRLLLASAVILVGFAACTALDLPSDGSFSGAATFSGPAVGNGWACEGRRAPAKGLPHVALNAAQFANGAACGACIEVKGLGKAKATDKPPLTGSFQVTVTNILTQGFDGDLDFPRDGEGRWAVDWSFIKCPGDTSSSRRLLQD